MRQPIQLLKDSTELFKSKWKLIFGIVTIVAILSLLESLLAPEYEVDYSSISQNLVFLLWMIANMFAGISLILVVSEQAAGIKDAYKKSLSFILSYLGLTICMSIATLVASLLLIVPGVIVSVWWAFAAIILILEGKGIIDSMKQSREYVRGKWWAVFGRLVFLGVTLVLVSVVVYSVFGFFAGIIGVDLSDVVLTFITTPFSLIYLYLLYKDVKGGTSVVFVSDSETATVSPEAV